MSAYLRQQRKGKTGVRAATDPSGPSCQHTHIPSTCTCGARPGTPMVLVPRASDILSTSSCITSPWFPGHSSCLCISPVVGAGGCSSYHGGSAPWGGEAHGSLAYRGCPSKATLRPPRPGYLPLSRCYRTSLWMV